MWKSLITGALMLAQAGIRVLAADKQPVLLVFGNSLSDVGNTFELTHHKIPPYGPYFKGRYSNGYVWNEWTSAMLGLTLDNRAFGGATSNNTFVEGSGVPSVDEQIQMFYKSNSTEANGGLPVDQDIVSIEIGSNDLIGQLPDLVMGSNDTLTNFTRQFTDRVFEDLDMVVAAGYKKFLLFNLPPANRSPSVIDLHMEDVAKDIVNSVNAGLKDRAEKYRTDHPGINLTVFDLDAVIQFMMDQMGGDLKINVLDKGCVTKKDGKVVTVCSDPDNYFFFDALHPTRKVHHLVGVIISKTIQDPTILIDAPKAREWIQQYHIVDGVDDAPEAMELNEYGNVSSENENVSENDSESESESESRSATASETESGSDTEDHSSSSTESSSGAVSLFSKSIAFPAVAALLLSLL